MRAHLRLACPDCGAPVTLRRRRVPKARHRSAELVCANCASLVRVRRDAARDGFSAHAVHGAFHTPPARRRQARWAHRHRGGSATPPARHLPA